MTSTVIGASKKVDYGKILGHVFLSVAGIGVVLYYVVIAANEGNGMFWWGVIAFIVGLVGIADLKARQSKRGFNAQLISSLLFFVFALLSPFMHSSTKNGFFSVDKVWMADGKTTMSHNIVWRSPFSRFATSIDKKQNVSFIVLGMTKDGAAVRATLSGAFSVSSDEQVVIERFGKMQNPDAETENMLKKALQKSFEQAIATMTVTDIATAKSNFAIEHAIVTLTAVDDLGLKGNGPIAMSDLHPYFVDK